ncbi:MAG: ThuA domain-containing protein [Pirellulales bacterium]
MFRKAGRAGVGQLMRAIIWQTLIAAGSGGQLMWAADGATGGGATPNIQAPGPLQLQLRTRSTDERGVERVSYLDESWDPAHTAVIVCDMWDAHHCLNAVRRVGEITPRMNAFLHEARRRGATIIHAPSECMEFYQNHPARLKAQRVPRAATLPDQIEQWCHWKDPNEEQVGYPIDHTDGGEDDDMNEHWRWHEVLAAAGRKPGSPWKRQTPGIDILDTDYISDDGVENWNILTAHGIDHVMLVGVHTNMCVLGRPFGLRQLSKNGKRVVLVRDLTDTMYNPNRRPFVSHFSGTDLVVEHVERQVCPTITSDQLLGGHEFRFTGDRRPHIVMMIGEDEYQTERTLPEFARKFLQRDFRLSFVHASASNPNNFPGLEVLDDADLLVVSVRRRTPTVDQLQHVRDFLAAGKPAVGIRTASHAFSLRDGQPPAAGHASWPEFDAVVWGGNYQGHYGHNEPTERRSFVQIVPTQSLNPLLTNISANEQGVVSWLYKTNPLAPGTNLLMTGRHDSSKNVEPVTWTYRRADGGRSFYTSLGHPADFAEPWFQRLLLNGTCWAAGLSVPASLPDVPVIGATPDSRAASVD